MEAIKTRRSIRRCKRPPCPGASKTVLNAARLAPSANNAQPWKIIVVMDKGIETEAGCRRLQSEVHRPGADHPCGLWHPRRGVPDRGRVYEQSCHGCLDRFRSSHTRGTLRRLGHGVRFAWFKEDKVREVLETCPRSIRTVAMTPLGYPDEAPERPPRKNLEELVLHERYQ